MRSCSALLRLDRTAHRRQGSARRGRAVAARARHGSEFREAGDNTYALHWAATHGDLEVVRAPLDAGGGVHGFGDVHGLEVIGWATVSHARRRFDGDGCLAAGPRFAPHRTRCPPPHLLGDVRRYLDLVEQNPETLDRGMSRFEQRQTPLDFAIRRKRYDILDLLIDLGADPEAEDQSGQNPLAAALLRGDREAVQPARRLHAADAKQPKTMARSSFQGEHDQNGRIHQDRCPDDLCPGRRPGPQLVRVAWVQRIARYADDGLVNFGMVSFGKAERILNAHGKPGPHDASLWFYTGQIDEI